ncbi:hypothetical protein BpHYR1_023783 [Brachionus plicatilis]|uniref:Uncharacterized protein n=1 Tax=Brachionus plicatilis TaxID=10195 RepID=A0A3M7QDF0_BRAPC|nr:hypothetical protein BpHYR1_023783 [Brachionus plicatilis]
MLQNSSSIDEFNQNLEDMVTIFCQPKLSQLLLRSLVRMNKEITIRNYEWLNQLFKKFDRKFLITSKESGIEDLYFPNDMSKNYISDSPFTNSLSNIEVNFSSLLEETWSLGDQEQKNKEFIFKKYIFSLYTSSSKLFFKSHMSVLIEDRSLEECTLKLGSFLANTLPYEILACLD